MRRCRRQEEELEGRMVLAEREWGERMTQRHAALERKEGDAELRAQELKGCERALEEAQRVQEAQGERRVKEAEAREAMLEERRGELEEREREVEEREMEVRAR